MARLGLSRKKDNFAPELFFEDYVCTEQAFDGIVGRSNALRSVLREIETVAPTDSTVLICTERPGPERN